MKSFLMLVSMLLVTGFLAGCDSNRFLSTLNLEHEEGIRNLTENEKAADFDQLLQLFKTNYGPYQYKEKRFGISIEKMILDLKVQAMNAKTDEEFMGYVMQVSAALKDGHVQFQVENSASNILRYKIPIMLATIEGKAIVAEVSADFTKWSGISQGDEILSVDGKTPADILALALKYRRAAQDLSDKALVIYTFLRPSYMTDLVPQSSASQITFKKQSGEVGIIEAPWETDNYSKNLNNSVKPSSLDLRAPIADDFNAILDSHRGQMGQVNPIFLNDSTQAKYKFVKVFPSSESMKQFGLKGDEKPGIYAALYKYKGKTLLLLRSATYSPMDYSTDVYMKTYMALLKEYQDLADVLVLDQTHNPGGSYCAEFYNLFAKENDVQGVEQTRADRKWINDLYINWPNEMGPTGNPWDIKQLLAWGHLVEKAYDQGQFLSEPFALFTGFQYAIKKDVNWTKPMLVLIDELAGSCGDIFPMLVKSNKRALLFGQKTMGLGGNVEEVGQLNNSRIHVRMTRGLFFPFRADGKYVDADFIENNGIAPDIEYAHTVEDFRNGYVKYVQTFSDKAVELVK